MLLHVLQSVEKCIRKTRNILFGRFAFRCSSLDLLQTPVPFREECRLHRKVRAPEMIGNCESVGNKILQILRHLQSFLLNFHENCCFFKLIFCENFEIAAVQKDANLAELEKCCQTHIFLQIFVLIQPRTSPPKICKNLLIFPILLTLTP